MVVTNATYHCEKCGKKTRFDPECIACEHCGHRQFQQHAKPSSKGEDKLAADIVEHGLLTVQREYRFHPTRQWRFDFAWPELKVAVEIEGAVFSRGRHTRGPGFTKDCIKYNAAAELGWTVLRFTTAQVMSGEAIDKVAELIK